VIDPVINVVRVYRRDGGQYGRADELSLERSDTLLPSLEIPLQRIFRDT
jgi:hypothetical protein